MRKRQLVYLIVSTLLFSFTVYLAVHAMIKVEGREPRYFCAHIADDPFCTCLQQIGDEDACRGTKTEPTDEGGGGGDETTWGTTCNDDTDLCYAWTNCPDGERADCIGEYQVQSDSTGVRCLDTGDAISSEEYCRGD